MDKLPDSDEFRAAMRLPATAVTVIAAGEEESRVGVTVSAVCSLSDNPPMILACVNLRSWALSTIRETRSFSVNFLSTAQPSIAECFAGRTGIHGVARFADAKWDRLSTGAPTLSDALAVFDCKLEHEHESSTHAILIGRVQAIRRNGAAQPLVYAGGAFSSPEPLQVCCQTNAN